MYEVVDPTEPIAYLVEHDPAQAAGPVRHGAKRSCHPSQERLRSAPIKLSILMPAYNEEETISQAINDVLEADYPCDIELIVVDDGSTDATWDLVSQVHDARVITYQHPINQGKGAAVLSAASLATGTHILPFDADLEYAPEDIQRLLHPILKGRCTVVYGARLSGCNTVYRSYIYAIGNRMLTRFANLLFNANLTDLHTCLKLLPLASLQELDVRQKGFGLDTEMTALLLRQGIRPFEVPVSYYSRSRAAGKKITWRDAVACVVILLHVRLRRLSPINAPKHREKRWARRLPHQISANRSLLLNEIQREYPERSEDDSGPVLQALL